VYSERVSTIDGAVVWTRTGPVDDVFRVLPDACMDIMWLGDELVVAGPDTTAPAGMSERQLRRRALDVFGYGPKMLGRILRMRRALELASSGVTLAHSAARAGYADQAHMTREVRSLAGVSLTALLG
jgi:hypothetical protein